MKQLTEAEVNRLQDYINSLQFECDKAKKTGYVAESYIKEKTRAINNLIK